MRRYPIVEELDTPLTALQLFELFKDRPFSFFLDSGMDPVRLGRYSFMGSDPFLVLSSRGEELTIIRNGVAIELCKKCYRIVKEEEDEEVRLSCNGD